MSENRFREVCEEVADLGRVIGPSDQVMYEVSPSILAAVQAARRALLPAKDTPAMVTCTLRDYFATEALGGLLRAGYSIESYKFAAEAYRLADAMLEARAVKDAVARLPLNPDP